MNIIYYTRDFVLSDELEREFNKKLSKLSRYFDRINKMEVEISKRRRKDKDSYKVEVTMSVPGTIIRSEVSADGPLTALNAVVDKLERQVKRYKEKKHNIKRETIRTGEFIEEEETQTAPISRKEQVIPEPMTPEEAVERMELIGHDFFIFKNSVENAICVVYRRKEGDYGLLVIAE